MVLAKAPPSRVITTPPTPRPSDPVTTPPSLKAAAVGPGMVTVPVNPGFADPKFTVTGLPLASAPAGGGVFEKPTVVIVPPALAGTKKLTTNIRKVPVG